MAILMSRAGRKAGGVRTQKAILIKLYPGWRSGRRKVVENIPDPLGPAGSSHASVIDQRKEIYCALLECAPLCPGAV